MYQSPTSLKPPLPPDCFHTEDAWNSERAAVFAKSWHLVGVRSQLARPGDYLSATFLGIPVVVRRFDDGLAAFRNVCAHRQCQLVSRLAGHSEAFRCPYHGWEFGEDGRTRKIPAAMNFPHFQREEYRLDRFTVACCGELVFVRLSDDGKSLADWFGERFQKFERWFSAPQWRTARAFRFEYPCNWKIPVEVSLESYHIPYVHPNTFGEDPGEANSLHTFFDTGTSFETKFGTKRWLDRRLKDAEQFMMRLLSVDFTGQYQHHHVFPNLLISHTDSLSLAQVVDPVTPSSSKGFVVQFGRESDRPGIVPRWSARGWGRFSALLTGQILNEDVRIYPLVQRGVEAAARPGLLGRCEERLHAFQLFVRECVDRLETTDHSTGHGPGVTSAFGGATRGAACQ